MALQRASGFRVSTCSAPGWTPPYSTAMGGGPAHTPVRMEPRDLPAVGPSGLPTEARGPSRTAPLAGGQAEAQAEAVTRQRP